jgi:RNA polymerase sigma factor (sigma-70 family)
MSNVDRHRLTPILERSVVGDPEALNTLLTEIRPYLHAQLRSQRGPTLGPADDSSIVQASLLRIYQHFGQLREHTVPHLLAWARRIVRNAMVDALRKGARDPVRPAGAGIDALAAPAADAAAADRDRQQALLAALGRLPQRQQQVVRWRYFDRLPDEEIGRRLGCSVGAVRVLRFRALRQLRRMMLKHPDFEGFPGGAG